MTLSLPDILKQQGRNIGEDSVQIPDIDFESVQKFRAVYEETQEEETETEAEEPEVEVVPPPEPPTREELIDLYRSELDEICREEASRAYYDALKKSKAELRDCLEQVDAQLIQMQELQAEYMENYADELRFMALEIAEKLILSKIEEDDLTLKKLVIQTVGSVKNATWLTIEVSERLVGLVDHIREALDKPEYHSRIVVNPIAAPIDTCRVTTEDGTIVSTISVQAENLKEAFETA